MDSNVRRNEGMVVDTSDFPPGLEIGKVVSLGTESQRECTSLKRCSEGGRLLRSHGDDIGRQFGKRLAIQRTVTRWDFPGKDIGDHTKPLDGIADRIGGIL